MSKYTCTVHDLCEGSFQIEVNASSDDAAYDEASIAASERGCANIVDIIVYLSEGSQA